MSTDDPFFDGALPSGIEPLDSLLGALVPGAPFWAIGSPAFSAICRAGDWIARRTISMPVL